MQIVHPFEPIYNKNSKILILGSFPSVKSRKDNFYYAHPQNRFWKILARILNSDEPLSIKQKKDMLLNGKVAIWDVLKSCQIAGSSDASIKNPVVNDIYRLLVDTDISCIFFNGNKAYDIYSKYLTNKPKIECIVLPSTSPANAAWSFEKLYEFWNRNIADKLNTFIFNLSAFYCAYIYFLIT